MVATESRAVLERGDEAPAFDLPSVEGGLVGPAAFTDYDALLLVFTCNHCPYAQAKFAEMNRLAEEYDVLAVVGINPNDETQYPQDDFETMRAWVEEGRIRWDDYLRDESGAVAAAYGAMCTPDPFLFENDDGVFRLVYHGRLDDAVTPDEEPTEREMADIVDRVLAGEDVDEEFRPSRGCSIKWREGNEPDYWDR